MVKLPLRAKGLLALSGLLVLAVVAASGAGAHLQATPAPKPTTTVPDAWHKSYNAITADLATANKAHAAFLRTVGPSWLNKRPQLTTGAVAVRARFAGLLARVKTMPVGTAKEDAVSAKLTIGLSDMVAAYDDYVDGFRQGELDLLNKGDALLRVSSDAFAAAQRLGPSVQGQTLTPFEEDLHRFSDAIVSIQPLVNHQKLLETDFLNELTSGGLRDSQALSYASQDEALCERIVAKLDEVTAMSDAGLEKKLVEYRQGWGLIRDAARDYVSGLRSRHLALLMAGDSKKASGLKLTADAEQYVTQLTAQYQTG